MFPPSHLFHHSLDDDDGDNNNTCLGGATSSRGLGPLGAAQRNPLGREKRLWAVSICTPNIMPSAGWRLFFPQQGVKLASKSQVLGLWGGCELAAFVKREIWGLCVEGGFLNADTVEVLVFLLLPGSGGDPEIRLLHGSQWKQPLWLSKET